MVDTVRTEAALLAIFADAQLAGSITAQDLRDFVVSIKSLIPAQYADLSSAVTITAAGINALEAVPFDTQNAIEGVTHSVSVLPSEIVISVDGVYVLQVGLQVHHNGGGSSTITAWVQADTGAGFVNVANTAVRQDLSNNDTGVLFLNSIGRYSAGDKVRLVWETTNVNGELVAFAAAGDVPAIPAVILAIEEITNG